MSVISPYLSQTNSSALLKQGKIVVKMEGNPPRQIFMTLKVLLSIKHISFTNFPFTCEYSNLPGNFSNQPMTG